MGVSAFEGIGRGGEALRRGGLRMGLAALRFWLMLCCCSAVLSVIQGPGPAFKRGMALP